ncbi:GGDEF domain-containing protein [Anaeromyxobacter diazotrophicus]|uniref:diguanylate cyclase n=1 Tax=Anaeromyxobacter diazotrophicus TaxID=2590199 RepID=A0A7I9VTN9_9BACT|nr:GGDEF domain-containing protein [Anaeromyxobacter diazotrophicus]GEJ59327.1 GGDEF domain-containing protein [Anaeromyxobacter diazotrophicus]
MPEKRPALVEQTFTTPVRPEAPAEQRPYLLVLSGPQFGEVFAIPAGRELVLGRSADADVQLFDDGVSRRHASLTAREREARLADLGSANGTWIGGERVKEAVLQDGGRFQVGAHTTLKFVLSDHVEAEYQHKLAQGALHEPLTGLYNRRHFMERLSAELSSAQRHARPLALLLVDIDHFKRVNDAHGHAAGDEVLKAVANVLQGAVRKEDVLARFGGEEFVVLSRETPLSGAKTLAERIRRAVERARLRLEGKEKDVAVTVSVGVTVSFGLTKFEPGRTEQQLLAAVERALHRAKQNGRNTVVAAPAVGP